VIRRLALRAAVFVSLAGIQGLAYFGLLRDPDLRWPFILLGSWVAAESLVAPSSRLHPE
jgi:hypothetical protein